MRTRDEGDLNRIKTKYGEEFLQSLVKASVGVGMVSNPAYNHARPYFINFRPILHNTRRLSDEELQKYNQYNDIVDDLEFSIDSLEKEKVDVFDLKMELKLVKDKVMSGNFSVVDIYLEGLTPRVNKEWEGLGKAPPKRQIQLVSQEEINKSVAEAKASRAKIEEEEAAKPPTAPAVNVKTPSASKPTVTDTSKPVTPPLKAKPSVVPPVKPATSPTPSQSKPVAPVATKTVVPQSSPAPAKPIRPQPSVTTSPAKVNEKPAEEKSKSVLNKDLMKQAEDAMGKKFD